MTTENKRRHILGSPFILIEHEEADYDKYDPRTLVDRVGQETSDIMDDAADSFIKACALRGKDALRDFGPVMVTFNVKAHDGHSLVVRYQWPGTTDFVEEYDNEFMQWIED